MADDYEILFDAVRRFVGRYWDSRPVAIRIYLESGERIELPIPPSRPGRQDGPAANQNQPRKP
jgi:hypothetical protein